MNKLNSKLMLTAVLAAALLAGCGVAAVGLRLTRPPRQGKA